MKLTRRGAVGALAATVGAAAMAVESGADAATPGRGESAFSGAALADSMERLLWYDKPAEQWLEALPIGNGRLGAMVFGGIEEERLQLNEGTLWAGGPHDYDNPEALAALPEIRRRIFAGNFHGAQDLVNAHFMSRPLRQAPYQTVGDIRFHLHGGSAADAADYRRELDLDNATIRVSYSLNGVRYTREAIASFPDQVIAIRFAADRPGQISFTATLSSPLHVERTAPDSMTVAIQGISGDADGVPGAVRFLATARIEAKGGRVSISPESLEVTGADSAVVLVSIATSYRNWRDTGGDAPARAMGYLARARSRWDELLRAHEKDYQRLYRRVSIALRPRDTAAGMAASRRPTNKRVAGFGEGNDAGLAALHFQFGRYLLISSSREGGQPATLQGLWNDSLNPPWGSKYTVNINTEMNYWPAATANLIECYTPLFQMLHELAVSGSATAKVHYGAGGWVCHHNTNGWRGAAPIDGSFWGMWPTGGAWLCKSFWDHYQFTHDVDALRKAYPVMRGAAEFFLNALVPDPVSGLLVTCPSVSPENAHHDGVSICAGPTMDMQILRDLFDATAAASELLQTDSEMRSRLQTARSRLVPMKIGKQGQLQEWMEDWDAGAPEQNHRHVSHLYGLFPGSQITPDGTPDLFAAARKSLETRGDAATGWSLAWKMNLWARLLDGDHAFKLLTDLISPERTAPNLFDMHPPFQIDGNFGAVSGVAEMLLQSHQSEIHLLPALPSAWPAGVVKGLCARGGFEIDLEWSDGRLTQAAVHSRRGGSCRLRYEKSETLLEVPAGGTVRWNGRGPQGV